MMLKQQAKTSLSHMVFITLFCISLTLNSSFGVDIIPANVIKNKFLSWKEQYASVFQEVQSSTLTTQCQRPNHTPLSLITHWNQQQSQTILTAYETTLGCSSLLYFAQECSEFKCFLNHAFTNASQTPDSPDRTELVWFLMNQKSALVYPSPPQINPETGLNGSSSFSDDELILLTQSILEYPETLYQKIAKPIHLKRLPDTRLRDQQKPNTTAFRNEKKQNWIQFGSMTFRLDVALNAPVLTPVESLINAQRSITHEFSHLLDYSRFENNYLSDASGFNQICGWQTSRVPGDRPSQDCSFVSNYASTSKFEDFAETIAHLKLPVLRPFAQNLVPDKILKITRGISLSPQTPESLIESLKTEDELYWAKQFEQNALAQDKILSCVKKMSTVDLQNTTSLYIFQNLNVSPITTIKLCNRGGCEDAWKILLPWWSNPCGDLLTDTSKTLYLEQLEKNPVLTEAHTGLMGIQIYLMNQIAESIVPLLKRDFDLARIIYQQNKPERYQRQIQKSWLDEDTRKLFIYFPTPPLE